SASESEELEESEFEKESSGSDEEDDSGASVASDSKVEILSAKVNQDFEAEDKALKATFSCKGNISNKGMAMERYGCYIAVIRRP
ncbi:hypothetical protein FRC08_018847, partial [Ceratobasidium sp. 394]